MDYDEPLPHRPAQLVLRGHRGEISCLQWDWTKIVSASLDGSWRIWGLNGGEELHATACTDGASGGSVVGGGISHQGPVSRVRVADTYVASASWDHTVKVWFFSKPVGELS